MTNVAISGLPAESALTGAELVPIVQSGTTSQSTTGAIAAFGKSPIYGSDYGASPSNADNSTAFNNAIAAAISEGRAFRFDFGTFYTNTVTLPPGHYDFRGQGAGNTVLCPLTAGDTVLSITGNGYVTGYFGDFSILGLQAGTGDGIYISGDISLYRAEFANITIQQMGGVGLHEDLGGGAFAVLYRAIYADGNLGHQFDLFGGNTTTLVNCYALRVPTNGTAGYRIRSSTPTLIGCNGINGSPNPGGQYWGIFGNSTTIDGGTDESCIPTLIGCNIEDFGLVGTQHRSNSPILINTTYLAASSGTVCAIKYDGQPNNIGQWINSSVNTLGAAWENGQPFHCRNSAPFLNFVGQAGASYEYYDDEEGLTFQVSALASAPGPYGTRLLYTSALKADTLFAGATGIVNQGAYADQSYNVQTPVSGFAITIPNNVRALILTPAGTLATGQITMPLDPIDGQEVQICTTQAITTLTLAGYFQVVANAPTTLVAGGNVTYKYRLAATTWYRIGN